MTPLSLLFRKGKQFTRWKGMPPFVILIAVLWGLTLLLVGKMVLAIVFISYGIILLESRISLRSLIQGFPGASILITLVRAFFFFLPLPFLGLPNLNPLSWGLLAGLAYGLILQLWQLSNLRLILSGDFIAILPPLSREQRFNEIVYPPLAGVAQEYFYRGALLYLLMGYMGGWAILLVTALFILEHLVHFNSAEVFDGYDILMQMILSLGLGVIFYFSSSLAGCMFGHIVYNGVVVLQAIQRKPKKENNLEII